CSHKRMSVALVRMGLNSPRNSRGASGFMSHMSMWDAPPQRKKSTADLAGFAITSSRGASGDAPRRARSGNPPKPGVDATRKSRRLSVGRNNGEGMATESGRSQQLLDDFAAFGHDGARAPLGIDPLRARLDSQVVKHGGGKVGGADAAGGNVITF